MDREGDDVPPFFALKSSLGTLRKRFSFDDAGAEETASDRLLLLLPSPPPPPLAVPGSLQRPDLALATDRSPTTAAGTGNAKPPGGAQEGPGGPTAPNRSLADRKKSALLNAIAKRKLLQVEKKTTPKLSK